MTAAKVIELDRTPKKFPIDVLNGTFFERNVPCEKMFVHLRSEPNGYARPLNERRAAKLAADFDPKAVGLLLLSMRDDGRFAIIDGQHRREAAIRNGVHALDAYVYIDLALEDEAGLYRKFGDYLKQSARDRFFAAVAEKQPEALAIQRLLNEFGLRVSADSGTQHGIAAVQSIWKVAENWGPHILRETIRTQHDAFDGNPLGYVGPSIVGMAMFLDRFNARPEYSRKRLIDRLQRAGAAKLEQQALHVIALERGDKGTAYGKALLAMHDAGVKAESRLGIWADRNFSEQSKVASRKRLLEQAVPASIAKRREGAIARALEVACPTCHVAKGKPCKGTDYVHMPRLRLAATKRREKAQKAS